METKFLWQSKTAWTGLVVALAAFFPDVQKFIQENPLLFAQIVGALQVGLRLITKDKIVLK